MNNFLGIREKKYCDFEKSKIVILPVPYEKTTTYIKGTQYGPAAIIKASVQVEHYDDQLNQETYKMAGIATAKPIKINHLSSQGMIQKAEKEVLRLLSLDKFVVCLGGEHSITVGIVNAYRKFGNFTVLQLDAHYDLQNKYHGSEYNHGCVARRISEKFPVVLAGTRSLSKDEAEFLKKTKQVTNFSNHTIFSDKDWIKKIIDFLSEKVYVSIDMDVFDPAFVPGVGTPEPGGLSWFDVINLLEEIAKRKKVIGFDVVELKPEKNNIRSEFFAAKLIYRFLGYLLKHENI